MAKTYQINECFLSLQGEGVRAGTVNLFVRFSGCNMKCDVEPGPLSPGGFGCDTEFVSGRRVTLDELALWAATQWQITLGLPEDEKNIKSGLRACPAWPEPWLILTGGEPGLQVDEEFCGFWHDRGCKLAIETNGTIDIAGTLGHGNRVGVDWISLSPKVAEHAVRCLEADEVRYVRGYGQGIPKPAAKALHHCISPAFDGGLVHPKTLGWCLKLVLENPSWRLSVQQHKTSFGGVR